MNYSAGLTLVLITAFSLLASCQTEDSEHMSEHQRQQLETAYDSIADLYGELEQEYNAEAESLSNELQSLYNGLQEMRKPVDNNHKQMMAWHEERDMHKDKMMPEESMGRHMQSQMTKEWYIQMKEIHGQLARMHENMNQQSLARMNRQLSEQFNEMEKIVPNVGEPTEIPFNEAGDPALLNGADLYTQNCASCHGSNGEGIGRTFPPLVDTEWITGDKSVPIRILLNGLSGEIEVNGQMYQGTMPSFKARLSAAEMASILNYLRDESEGDQPGVTQKDVIEFSQKYDD